MSTAKVNSNITMGVEGLPAWHRCPWWMQYMLVSPLRRLMEPAKRLLGSSVAPGMTVLEPGCGFGYVSLALARQVGPEGRVVCVDIEPRAVNRLLKRARRKGLADRIVARSCGPRDLGLAELVGEVDLVTAIHTLHEFEDLPGFLEQAALLLKPGGRMLVVEPPGHISPEEFAAELEVCRRAGFRELDYPPVSRRHPTALLSRG